MTTFGPLHDPFTSVLTSYIYSEFIYVNLEKQDFKKFLNCNVVFTFAWVILQWTACIVEPLVVLLHCSKKILGWSPRVESFQRFHVVCVNLWVLCLHSVSHKMLWKIMLWSNNTPTLVQFSLFFELWESFFKPKMPQT